MAVTPLSSVTESGELFIPANMSQKKNSFREVLVEDFYEDLNIIRWL